MHNSHVHSTAILAAARLLDDLGLDPRDIEDLVDAAKHDEACEINADGAEAQLAYLLSCHDPEDLATTLRALAPLKTPLFGA